MDAKRTRKAERRAARAARKANGVKMDADADVGGEEGLGFTFIASSDGVVNI